MWFLSRYLNISNIVFTAISQMYNVDSWLAFLCERLPPVWLLLETRVLNFSPNVRKNRAFTQSSVAYMKIALYFRPHYFKSYAIDYMLMGGLDMWGEILYGNKWWMYSCSETLSKVWYCITSSYYPMFTVPIGCAAREYSNDGWQGYYE